MRKILPLIIFLSAFTTQSKEPWPFDQRNILLVRVSGDDYPDDASLAQIMDVFVERGRIRWVTQKGDPAQIVPLQVPVDFPWHSAPSVRAMGLKYKADGILYFVQEGIGTELRWYSTLDGLPMVIESVKIPAAGSDAKWQEQRRARLKEWAHQIWDHIPGNGYVVQRRGNEALVEGLDPARIKVGQRIDFIRIDKVNRHPILKTLSQIESSATAYGEVTSIQKNQSQVKIQFESEIDPLQEGDRYSYQVSAKVTPPASVPEAVEKEVPENIQKTDVQEASTEIQEVPSGLLFFNNTKKIFDLYAGFSFGQMTHDETITSTSRSMKSSSFSPGFDLGSTFYITRSWISGLDYSQTVAKFTDVHPGYGRTKVNSGLSTYKIFGGYRFLIEEGATSSAELRVTAGYRSWALAMEDIGGSIAPSAKSYEGLELGVLVGFPIYKGVGASFSGGKMLGASLSEKPRTSGDTPDASFWHFGGGLSYDIKGKGEARIGYRIETGETNFDGQGQRGTKASTTLAKRSYFTCSYINAF
ncbi:MAG: hypothetical protein KA116_07360 [Proteobacteria bacterium]|nr:hypothetical protein [Pseudomonadota bacterium]